MELQICDVSKTYPSGVQTLKHITLNIPTGMFGLVGPNGAGKSTLMRTLAGVDPYPLRLNRHKEEMDEKGQEVEIDTGR